MTKTIEIAETRRTQESPVFQSLMRFYGAEGRYSASGGAADRTTLLDTLHPDIVL